MAMAAACSSDTSADGFAKLVTEGTLHDEGQIHPVHALVEQIQEFLLVRVAAKILLVAVHDRPMDLGQETDAERLRADDVPVRVELDAAQDGVEVDGLTGDDARRGGVDLGENLRDGVAIGGGGECLVDVADDARGADLEALILPREGGAPPTRRGGLDAGDEGGQSVEDGGAVAAAVRGFEDDLAKRASGP